MPLVDYASDSDDETASTSIPPPVIKFSDVEAPPPKARPRRPAGGGLFNLPPPASSLNEKGEQGDLVGEVGEGPARKRAKLSVEGGARGGLASILPAPKNTGKAGGESKRVGGVIGVRLGLSGRKREEDDASATDRNASDNVGSAIEDSVVKPELSLPASSLSPSDFFGLGGVSSVPSLTVPSSLSTSVPSVSISSAPVVVEEQPPPPSLLDPYPGYWQRKSGEWVARDTGADPVWAAFYAEHYSKARPSNDEAPKDFQDAVRSPMGEFNAGEAARKAYESRSQIVDPREEARKQDEAKQEGKPKKMISTRAKGRHQLTSLLSEAQANRAELEERIARGKANRKMGGAKYGF